MAIDILIVDDEKDIRDILSSVMQDEGYSTREASNSDEALSAIEEKKPNLVVLDVWLNNSKLDGIEILEKITEMYDDVPVIIISGHGTLDMAVSATKKGAYDFLSKPFKTDALLNTITHALDKTVLKQKNKNLISKLGVGDNTLIGKSKNIVDLQEQITKISKLNTAVMIYGDAGTGKDIIAQMIHEQSNGKGSFIVVDSNNDKEVENSLFGTLKPRTSGAFEQASGGTIVIDNMSGISDAIQAKIAKTIATNKIILVGSDNEIDVSAKIIIVCRKKSDLHADLKTRLKGSEIKSVALKDRISDIELLANQFMIYRARAKGRKPIKLDSSAITALMNHNWTGNVWELINVIDALLLNLDNDVASSVEVNNELNFSMKNNNRISFENILMKDLRNSRGSYEKYYLSFHLKRFDGNITKTADFVKMDRAALSRKIKSLGIGG